LSGKNGENGTSIIARYSADKTNWHSAFITGDQYMQTSTNGIDWGDIIKIVGENGENGAYTDYSFAISSKLTTTSSTTAPADVTTWSDGPVATTTSKPYLWMRVIKYDGDGVAQGNATYTRLTGEKGNDGSSIIARYSKDGTDWHSTFQSDDIYM